MSDIFSSQTKHLVFRSPGIGLIDVDIHGNLTVHSDETTLREALIVEGNTKIIGRPSNAGPNDNALEVEGDVVITTLGVGKPALLVYGDTNIVGDTDITGDTEIHGGLGVGLDTELHGNLTVDLDATISGSLSVQGGTTLEGPLTVNDSAHITGDLTVDTHTTLNTLNAKGDSVFDQTVLITGDLTVRGDLTIIGNGEQIIENQKSLAVEDPLLYLNFGVLNIAQDPESKGMIIDRGLFSIINVNNGTSTVATVERVNYESGKWFIKLDGSGIPVWRDDPTYSHHGQTLTTAVINSGTYPAPTPSPINNTNAPASVVWSETGGTGGTGTWLLNWALQDRKSLSPDGGTTPPASLPAVPVVDRTLRGLDTPLTTPAVDYAVNVKYLTQETDKINNRITNLKLDNLFDVQATGPVQDAVLYYDTALINWIAREFEIRRDTTPELGGDLDVKARSIVSKTSNPIKLAPNYDVVPTGFIQLNGAANVQTITTSATTDLVLNPTRDLKLFTVAWPKTAGTLDQIVALDSSGNRLVWKNTVHSIVAGEGLSSVGAKTTGDIIFDVNVGGAGTGVIISNDTIIHEDTSTQANVVNTNGVVIQSLTFDTFGHVKTVASLDLDTRYNTITSADAKYVNVTGDTMTGDLTAQSPAKFIGPLTGNASTATKLFTARSITLTGDVTSPAVNFDGSANISITATVVDDSHNHIIDNIDGLQDILTEITTTPSSVYVSDVPPPNPAPNTMWFDTIGGRLYVYYNDGDSVQWVEASPQSSPEDVLRGELSANTGAGMIGTTSGNTVQVELNNKVPITRTINAKPLSANVTLNAADVGAVNTTNGVAPFAAALQTARTISLGGDLSGGANFDGTGNITISATVIDDSHAHIIGNVDGLQAALDAKLDSTGNAASATKLQTARTISLTGDVTGSVSFDGTANASITATVVNDSHNHTIANVTGLQAALDAKLDSTANAVSATKLQTARTISLAGDVTGSVSFDGTANASITAIVANDSHNHTIANITGLQAELDSKFETTGGTISGSVTATGRVTAVGTGNDYASGGFEVRGNGASNTVFPTIGFHQPGSYAASFQLRGGDDFRLYAQGASAYARLSLSTLYATGNGDFNDVNVRSDIRLKSNLTVIDSALSKLQQLTGYTYDKKQDLTSIVTKREAGIVAQQLREVLPEAVSEVPSSDISDERLLSISSSGVNALLVESVKELSNRVDQLLQKVEDQQRELDVLQNILGGK